MIMTMKITIFFVIRFNNKQKTECYSLKMLNESIDNTYLFNLIKITLDYQKFNNQCHEVNMILAKHGYFLRVFELRNKFRHLTLKNPKKQNIVRQLSSCVNEKYNCFHVISIKYSKRLRKNLKPIDIIYKPIKSLKGNIQCYYSSNIKIIQKFLWQ